MIKTRKVIALLWVVMFFAISCNKPEEPINDENTNVENDSVVDPVIHDGHDYVDLGLPSGTLWATCNIGADQPEGRGDYFAWGETVAKDYYDWKSYRYGSFVNEWFELNKYCSDSCYGVDGFIDGLTVLESDDDVATACWGPDWRMPTKEEWEELYQETSFTWTTINGVDGRLLTGSNGNSIFVPATGFRLDGEFIGPGLGVYWSNTLHTGFPERAWSYHFDWESCHVCGTYERSRGQAVRAVRCHQ